MADSVVYSNDLRSMDVLYYEEDVVRKESCLNQSEEQLQILFQKKIEEAQISFETAQILLNGENTSVPYSECIVVVEKACLSAKNIKEVLSARNLLLSSEMTTSLVQLEENLESTRQLQPNGETTLQLKDIELVQQMSMIPTNEIYTSDQGIVYYQPKVSHMNIRPFFEAYCKNGGYKSVQTSTKQTNCFFFIDFKENFHLVSLMKTKEQALAALERCQATTSDMGIVESRFSTSDSDKDFFGGLLTTGAQMFPSLNWMKEEIAPKVGQNSGLKGRMLRQKSALKDIALHLPRVIQEEKWGFEKFIILNLEEQLKLGIPPRDAVMADCVLLFHKKVEAKS